MSKLSAQNECEIKVSDLSDLNAKMLVPVSMPAISQLLTQVDLFFEEKPITTALMAKLRAVIYEAITNVVEHSGLPSSRKIELNIRLCNDHIELILRSGGNKFDSEIAALRANEKSAGPPYKKRGYGLKCIASMVNSLKYNRTKQGLNEFILTFNKE